MNWLSSIKAFLAERELSKPKYKVKLNKLELIRLLDNVSPPREEMRQLTIDKIGSYCCNKWQWRYETIHALTHRQIYNLYIKYRDDQNIKNKVRPNMGWLRKIKKAVKTATKITANEIKKEVVSDAKDLVNGTEKIVNDKITTPVNYVDHLVNEGLDKANK